MSVIPHIWTTVHADASFKDGRGSWAAWVKTSAGRVVRSGACPEYVRNSGHAELAAVFAGIHLAVSAFPHTTAILVRSDCRAALHNLAHRASPSSDPAVQRLRERIRTALGDRHVRIKWVKGHRGGDTVESWVNNACDRLAREARSK